jgi:hypothetical protein
MSFPLRSSLVVALALVSSVADAQVPPKEAKPTPTASGTKPAVPKSDAPKPAEAKPAEPKPSATKTAEPKTTSAKPAESKPAEPKPNATKPADPKASTAKPAEVKPSEAKPAPANEAKPKPAEKKPAAPKPEVKKPAAPKVEVPEPSAAEIEAAKKNPFDGKSLAAWTTPAGKAPGGWIAKDGVITLPRGVKGGNIVTRDDFGSFSLEFEWKIEKGGNSGIKYRVRNYDGKGMLGIEYQIYDDPANGPPKGSTASIYNIYAPNAKRKTKPIGEFNTAKILVRGNYIEHWLNGEMVASATIGSADWLKHVGESKFNDVKDFALNPSGKIMLTDHSTEVTFRNMKFEVLPEPKPVGTGRPVFRRRGLFRNW